ncbi:MAG: PD-(D/E)XK nuclease family transposase [Schwartzia sp.]|nr:PD-(D/E)XK nuclease family transposase [Schwartzia sp. (in: firmicutes)]
MLTDNQREKHIERIQRFRYIDDVFFSVAFDGFKRGVELILRTVLNDESIIVEELYTQKDVVNWYGRSVRFDVFASTGNKRFNCEIQRENSGAIPKRARYNSSLLDAREAQKGTDYADLSETIVILICEHDIFKKGLPLYHVKKIISETGDDFDDGSSIVYVNGQCQEDTPLGHLMHDFFCRNAKDIYNQDLADRMKYLKEDQGGVQSMCEIMEELVNEGREQGIEQGIKQGKERGKMESLVSSIRNLMKTMNLTAKQAMDALLVPPAEQEKIVTLI